VHFNFDFHGDHSYHNSYLKFFHYHSLKKEGHLQKQYPIAEAKNKLQAIIHDVEEGSIVQFTRRGRPVAVLVSLGDYERLSKQKKGFWAELQAFRSNMLQYKNIVIGDADFKRLRDTDSGREMYWSK
jgi:antitoxin Phd